MAIFQPSNITPSSFAGIGGGTVCATDKINISWQVNGTSPMTEFKIDILNNTTDNSSVHTEKITLAKPFYGTDYKGNTNFYEYVPDISWQSWGLEDGKSYKMKITQYWDGGSIEQYSESVFITRTTPVLKINFFTSPINSVAYTFSADYSQAQKDEINFCRWTLFDSTIGKFVSDTENISTSELIFDYKGLFNSHSYILTCTVETQNGVQISDSVSFDANYIQNSTKNQINSSLQNDGSLLISWQKATDILGHINGNYGISDEELLLEENSSAVWDSVNDDLMNFSAPYAVAWKGNTEEPYRLNRVLENAEKILALSSDKKFLAVKSCDGPSYAYTSDNGTYTKICKLMYNESYVTATCGAFSADGKHFVLGAPNGYLYVYSVSETSFDFKKTIGETSKYQPAYIAFSPDGNLMAVGYERIYYTGYTRCYPVYDSETFQLGNFVNLGIESFCGAFHPNPNSPCAIFGSSNGKCYLFCYDDNNIRQKDTYTSPSYKENYTCLGWGKNHTDIFLGGDCWQLSDNYDALSYKGSLKINGNLFVPNGIVTNSSPVSEEIIATYSDGIYFFTQDLILSQKIYSDQKINTPFLTDTDTLLCGYAPANYISGNIREYKKIFRTVMTLSSDSIKLVQDGIAFSLYDNNSVLLFSNILGNPEKCTVAFTPQSMTVYSFTENGVLCQCKKAEQKIDEVSITSVNLIGMQKNDFTYITNDIKYDFARNDYIPERTDSVIFYADYSDGLQAGTYSNADSGVQNAIYRSDGKELVHLGIFPTSITKIKDYGIRNVQSYTYNLYYLMNGIYSDLTVSNSVCTNFDFYTLIEAYPDSDLTNVYHVINSWTFGTNFETMSISNNNTPTYLQNFTRYPLKQPSSQAFKSGELRTLIGSCSNGRYSDTNELMNELYELSLSSNPLFLKDLKGNLYMINIASPIIQTVNTKSEKQEVSITLPWQESGSADGIALIKLIKDELL